MGNHYIYDTTKTNIITKFDLDNWRGSTNTSDYDFVINTANQTFRLPLLNGERVLVAKKEPTDGDYTWYNLYSDGWLEQGGYIYQAGNVTGVVNTTTLPKAFKNNDYSLTMFAGVGDSGWQYANGVGLGTGGAGGNERETRMTPKTFTWFNATGITGTPIFWEAKGYAEVPTQSDYTEVKGLYFYVGDTVQDASLINTGGVLSDLATKTNSVQAAAASMPSNRYIVLTLGASGSTYTAPANGWYFLSLHNGSANTYSYMQNLTANNIIGGGILLGITEQRLLPVKKGDSITIFYGAIDAQDKLLLFIYAEGEN